MSDTAGHGRPLLLGHRGQRHTRRSILQSLQQQNLPPDNTLAAFELSLQRGCDGFEFDVRYTHDRRGVICHDPDFAGLSVASSIYETLQAAKPRHERRERRDPDEQMPCLEDVLARFADRAYLDIEIKIAGFGMQGSQAAAAMARASGKCRDSECEARVRGAGASMARRWEAGMRMDG